MGEFRYTQAEEIRDAFAAHDVKYPFIGKSGAILLGFPDTTQDADLFVAKSSENGRATVAGLRQLGFELSATAVAEIERGKDFIQLKNGPFDLDLIFAPDGTIRRSVATQDFRGRISGLPNRRHYCQQASDGPREGSGVSAPAARVPRVLAST